MPFISIFLVLYAAGSLCMTGQCEGDRLISRHDSAHANWSPDDRMDSSHCCDTCFCCSILIVTEQFCPSDELRIAGTSIVLPHVLPPSCWIPSIYHPPKAA